MKLCNKKTGEIAYFHYLQTDYIAQLVLTVKEPDTEQYGIFKYNQIYSINIWV